MTLNFSFYEDATRYRPAALGAENGGAVGAHGHSVSLQGETRISLSGGGGVASIADKVRVSK